MAETPRSSRLQNNATGDKAEAIVQAAARLFATAGFERTTTKAIAREAGVAEGTLYLYFGSKKQILLAFVERVVLLPLRDAFADAGTLSEREAIERFLRNRLRLWQQHGDLLKVVFAEALFDAALARAFCDRILTPATVMVEEYLRERAAGGRLRAPAPRAAAQALVGSVFSASLLYGSLLCPGAEAPAPDETARHLAALFCEGLTPPGP